MIIVKSSLNKALYLESTLCSLSLCNRDVKSDIKNVYRDQINTFAPSHCKLSFTNLSPIIGREAKPEYRVGNFDQITTLK